MKILVNALTAKRKSGGGFQIAVNFIKATLSRMDVNWLYFVSEDVDAAIGNYFSLVKDLEYFVFPTQPDFLHSYLKVRKEIRRLEPILLPDIVYSINSPSYFSFSAPEVMRFANAWVTNPNRYAQHTLGMLAKIRNTLYCMNQRRLMKKRRYFITQSETVKQGIIKITRTDSAYVAVISNVLPAYFSEQKLDIFTGVPDGKINVACVAAPFKHKNLTIIPDVLNELREKYKMEHVVFHVTIPKEHPVWVNMQCVLKELGLEKQIINYGYCSQEKLVGLYTQCDMAFLPSLLETFSASILEAMFFRLPIVASDFDFNKEVAGACAVYFRPMDVRDAAAKIAGLIQFPVKRNTLIASIPAYLKKYASYDKHIDGIIDFLKGVAG